MKRSILLWLPILALAGCGQQPLHSEKYYMTHKAALKRELVSCKPMYAPAKNKAEQDRQWHELLNAYHDKNHKVLNCLAAHSAESSLNNSKDFGGPMNNSIMP